MSGNTGTDIKLRIWLGLSVSLLGTTGCKSSIKIEYLENFNIR